MYVDNRKGADSVRAVLIKQDGSRSEGIIIDVKSVVMFFVALLGLSLAVVGTCALCYSLYLAIFFK